MAPPDPAERSDVELARAADPRPIAEVAAELGLTGDDLDLYGATRRS